MPAVTGSFLEVGRVVLDERVALIAPVENRSNRNEDFIGTSGATAAGRSHTFEPNMFDEGTRTLVRVVDYTAT